MSIIKSVIIPCIMHTKVWVHVIHHKIQYMPLSYLVAPVSILLRELDLRCGLGHVPCPVTRFPELTKMIRMGPFHFFFLLHSIPSSPMTIRCQGLRAWPEAWVVLLKGTFMVLEELRGSQGNTVGGRVDA